MVLGDSHRENPLRNSHVVLALIDIERGSIDHIVLYDQVEGALTTMIGSSDFGPFDTELERIQWLLRTLHRYHPVTAR